MIQLEKMFYCRQVAYMLEFLQLIANNQSIQFTLFSMIAFFSMGTFFLKYFWPWFRNVSERFIDEYLSMKNLQIQYQHERSKQLQTAIDQQTKLLGQMIRALDGHTSVLADILGNQRIIFRGKIDDK